jgi:hypothetical protein
MPTHTDLYRLGNASSPRMDNVRVGKDIETYDRNGDTWVQARSGGVSTFSSPIGGVGNLAKNQWKLDRGYSYDPLLYVVNDHGNHYNWEPNRDMPLSLNYFLKKSIYSLTRLAKRTHKEVFYAVFTEGNALHN